MSVMTETYPLRGLPVQAPAVAVPRVPPWGFWATLGWFGVAVIASIVASFVTAICYAVWWRLTQPGIPVDFTSPLAENVGFAVAMLAMLPVVVLAARRAGGSARDYLGLVWPHRKYILIGLGLLVAEWFFCLGLGQLIPSESSETSANEYGAALGSPTALVLYWIGLVAIAPVVEEIVFRGFIMRGWMDTWLGIPGTIVLSALIFALLHAQYDAIGMIAVFVGAINLGLMRWLSGSTVLTIMMHAAWNLTIGVTIALTI